MCAETDGPLPSLLPSLSPAAIPCVCLGVEVQDLFGSLGSSSDRGLLRYATTSDGVVKPGRSSVSLSNDYSEMTRHVGEGCNIFGQLTVESVPGNFRLVPALSFAQLQLFYPQQFINTSHTVHFLYFGDLTRAQLRHERLSSVIVMDSIRDHTRTVEDDESAALHQQHVSTALTSPSAASTAPAAASPPSQFHFSKSFEYYLKIVATHYTSPAGVTYRSYQYTSHGNDVVIPRELPAIWFRYDFSPITIKVSRQHASFAHFLVQLCAILGGTFSVLRIVHALIGLTGKGKKGDARNAVHEQQQSVDAPAARIPQSAYVGQLEMRRGAAGGDVKPLLSPETRALLPPPSHTTQQQFAWTGGETMSNGGAAGRQGWTAENGGAAGHAQQQQQQQPMAAAGTAMQRHSSARTKGHDD